MWIENNVIYETQMHCTMEILVTFRNVIVSTVLLTGGQNTRSIFLLFRLKKKFIDNLSPRAVLPLTSSWREHTQCVLSSFVYHKLDMTRNFVKWKNWTQCKMIWIVVLIPVILKTFFSIRADVDLMTVFSFLVKLEIILSEKFDIFLLKISMNIIFANSEIKWCKYLQNEQNCWQILPLWLPFNQMWFCITFSF